MPIDWKSLDSLDIGGMRTLIDTLTADNAALREAVAVLRAACEGALKTDIRFHDHWGSVLSQCRRCSVEAALEATSRFAEEPTDGKS